jgi:hypothetical protein
MPRQKTAIAAGRAQPRPNQRAVRVWCAVDATATTESSKRRDGVCAKAKLWSALVCRLSQHVRNPRTSLRSKAHSVSTHACVAYTLAFSRRRVVARGTRSRARGLARQGEAGAGAGGVLTRGRGDQIAVHVKHRAVCERVQVTRGINQSVLVIPCSSGRHGARQVGAARCMADVAIGCAAYESWLLIISHD